jgi:hypothetical protein
MSALENQIRPLLLDLMTGQRNPPRAQATGTRRTQITTRNVTRIQWSIALSLSTKNRTPPCSEGRESHGLSVANRRKRSEPAADTRTPSAARIQTQKPNHEVQLEAARSGVFRSSVRAL